MVPNAVEVGPESHCCEAGKSRIKFLAAGCSKMQAATITSMCFSNMELQHCASVEE